MASPIGHGLVGLGIGRLCQGDAGPTGPLLLAACIVFAIAPDLDFLPGIAAGQPALHHQGASHSVFVGLGLSVIAALLCWRGRVLRLRAAAALFAAYASHLVIDLFGPDRRPPIGIPLFWPVSDATFLSPLTLLPGIQHASATSTRVGPWLDAVLSWVNFRAIAVEIAVAAPLLLIAELRRRRRN
jgi:inner membrane protein